MNFTHTEDRRMLADTLGRFVAEQVGFEARMATAASPEGFSRARWAAFAELGAVGALFAEADGGYGGAGFDIAVVFEALGAGLVLEPFLPALMAGSALAHAGTAEQKTLLEPLLAGANVATLAHEEPGSFYDLQHVATRAQRQGDGWVLQGHKTAVLLGDQADWLLVSARTSGQATDAEGINVRDALHRIGYLGDAPVGQRPLGAYFEAHIEQGGLLEASGKRIGVVTAIIILLVTSLWSTVSLRECKVVTGLEDRSRSVWSIIRSSIWAVPSSIASMLSRRPDSLPPRVSGLPKPRWVPEVVHAWLLQRSGQQPQKRQGGRPRTVRNDGDARG